MFFFLAVETGRVLDMRMLSKYTEKWRMLFGVKAFEDSRYALNTYQSAFSVSSCWGK